MIAMIPDQTALAAAAIVALIAAAFDWRSRRIPNWLSMSALAAGLLFRGLSEGTSGLGDAGAGFVVAVLPLLVLWLIGGGGGGDVKLMAGLSVWLGYQQSVMLLIGSTVGVLVFHCAVMIVRSLRRQSGGLEGKAQLRVAFAIPVCLAAWALVAFDALQHVGHP
jgi:prepilin peptidase CpaA